nr:transposase [Burkholderia pyrrocinia]
MTEKQDLRSRLVVGRRRDGRREFDEDAVRELIGFCLKSGVSIARAAMDHDVNPNQLRRWISRHQQHTLQTPTRPDPLVIDGVSIDIPGSARRVPVNEASAFVPVVAAPSSVRPAGKNGSQRFVKSRNGGMDEPSSKSGVYEGASRRSGQAGVD